ncbi:hypothetical protein CGC58_12480 [Capnocytophaga stomatis]|uniref:Uncharacterized protein n=1 Tax=Capnocytophaga stomatis TaxID=1848904 RepID=A0A250FZD6_9FLAO|nr:hypothetical protein CGC58_12480 [Capnocytophaga stomatis]
MGNNPFFYYIFAQSSLIFILLCKTKMLKILGTFNFPLKKFRQVYYIKKRRFFLNVLNRASTSLSLTQSEFFIQIKKRKVYLIRINLPQKET